MMIPGVPGVNGAAGAAGGTFNNTIYLIPDAPEMPDEPFMIPGAKGDTGAAGAGGSSPTYDADAYTLANGEYKVYSRQMIISGTDQVVLNGNSSVLIV
jgi:hypothetical protein